MAVEQAQQADFGRQSHLFGGNVRISLSCQAVNDGRFFITQNQADFVIDLRTIVGRQKAADIKALFQTQPVVRASFFQLANQWGKGCGILMLRHCKPVVLQDMREAQQAIWTNLCADALNHFGDMRTSFVEL